MVAKHRFVSVFGCQEIDRKAVLKIMARKIDPSTFS
jgi:hypothetical protein